MDKKMRYLITVSSVIIIGFIIILCVSNKERLFVKSSNRVNLDSLNICNRNYGLQLRNVGKKIPNLWIRGDSITQLSKLSKPLLVLYIAESHCTKCVDKELNMLETYCKDIENRIMILASLHNYKDIEVFKQENHIKYPVYLISRDSFEWDINQLEKPYYFILDRQLRISNLHITDEIYPNLSILFLKGVNELLTNK